MTRSLRILLLQARTEADPALEQEVECFSRHTRLAREQFTPFDLLGGAPTAAHLQGYDAMMVGGSGHYYVSKRNLPHLDGTLEFLRDTAERGFPTFASCFGYQLFIQALGGEIIHDPERIELGTVELTLTAAGRDDPLLGTLPARFAAQMGHKDRAARPPDGVPNLAGSALCPNQALRLPGRPVWATQFHPELDRDSNQARYLNYIEGYSNVLDQEEQRRILASFAESPECNQLLGRFIELVFS